MSNQFSLPEPFQGSVHQPFFWKGSDRAVLLIHGFPGTPAEMRPLGLALAELGWTVEGLMLPGMGRDISTLHQRRLSDWTGDVACALERLRKDFTTVLVAGYSMGGALASVRPKTPFFWKTGRLTFECNMRVSCFDVRKAKFFSYCEWEREFRQFLDAQIRMITKVMPVTKPAFVFS